MAEKNERKEKSEILFKKAMDCYVKQEYEEALKYFKACISYCPNERAELFIRVCENNIPSNNSNSESQSNYQKSYSSSFSYNNKDFKTNDSNNNSYSHNNSFTSQTSSNSYDSRSQDNNDNDSDDKRCKELLKKKDYYDLLNVKKDATAEEIKRGYKKQAIRFHPDKNHSKLAGDCFKKISEAYQCLSDTEKRQFYDKYGNEEEFRQKYYQTHQYYEEEMDPYDIFEILFGGPGMMNGRGRRRGRHFHFRQANNVHFNDFGGTQLKGKSVFLVLVPFFLIVILQVLPEIYTLLKPAPLYQFHRNIYYPYTKKTSKNYIDFYVNDEFLKKYPQNEDFVNIENQIEKEYLEYLHDNCLKVINRKQELEYYMRYTFSNYERIAYKNQIDRLNYNFCKEYNRLNNRINRG